MNHSVELESCAKLTQTLLCGARLSVTTHPLSDCHCLSTALWLRAFFSVCMSACLSLSHCVSHSICHDPEHNPCEVSQGELRNGGAPYWGRDRSDEKHCDLAGRLAVRPGLPLARSRECTDLEKRQVVKLRGGQGRCPMLATISVPQQVFKHTTHSLNDCAFYFASVNEVPRCAFNFSRTSLHSDCQNLLELQRLTLLHVNSNQCLDMPSEEDKMVPTLRDCTGSRSQHLDRTRSRSQTETSRQPLPVPLATCLLSQPSSLSAGQVTAPPPNRDHESSHSDLVSCSSRQAPPTFPLGEIAFSVCLRSMGASAPLPTGLLMSVGPVVMQSRVTSGQCSRATEADHPGRISYSPWLQGWTQLQQAQPGKRSVLIQRWKQSSQVRELKEAQWQTEKAPQRSNPWVSLLGPVVAIDEPQRISQVGLWWADEEQPMLFCSLRWVPHIPDLTRPCVVFHQLCFRICCSSVRRFCLFSPHCHMLFPLICSSPEGNHSSVINRPSQGAISPWPRSDWPDRAHTCEREALRRYGPRSRIR
ncbi:hypothetical protein JZ751_027684 [Albula glossodonta]|uniref:Uncharacterized protein n=1 Tax=Albula glossodonta TaxID=121402 RepID=A0A8T2PDH9_9TELE|nr:hypothetical protein JZ751_027684 [Albula glossodonta]